MIFKTDCDDKLKKRIINWINFKEINRAIRKNDINILKTFINDFLNDIIIFLSDNEIEQMFKFNIYLFLKKQFSKHF